MVVSSRNFRIVRCFAYRWSCCCLPGNIASNVICRSSESSRKSDEHTSRQEGRKYQYLGGLIPPPPPERCGGVCVPLLDVGEGGRCDASSVRLPNSDGREQRREQRECVATEAREELPLTLWVRAARRRHGAVAVFKSAPRQRVRRIACAGQVRHVEAEVLDLVEQRTYILLRCWLVLSYVTRTWSSWRRAAGGGRSRVPPRRRAGSVPASEGNRPCK